MGSISATEAQDLPTLTDAENFPGTRTQTRAASQPRPASPPSAPVVAMVNESQRRDGHQQMFETYCRALSAVGLPYSVYQCVDPSLASEYATAGRRVVGRRLPGSGLLEMGYNRFFEVFPKRLGPMPEPIVHVNDAFLAPLVRYRRNVVVTLVDLVKLTTAYFPRVAVWLYDRSLREIGKARAVIAPSHYVRQELLAHLPLAEPQVHVVPLRSLLPPLRTPRPAPEPPTAERPWTLLYVARDRPRKNLPFFFELLRRLGHEYRGLLVSQVRPPTSRQIARLGLGSRLQVLPWADDLTPIYRSAHVLVHTAPYEGFGIPLAEAASQGLPVVASNRTSIPEVVGAGGILLEPNDTASWLEAIRRLTDSGVYSGLSEAAREQADRVSLVEIGSRLRAAYGLSE